MSIQIQVPETVILRPCITVFGVGGAGCNAVKNMIDASLEGVNFVVANTDAQTLEHSNAERKIPLGEKTTKGLGAGASPQVGREAAEESKDLISEHLEGVNMVFVTAGMGGGTGTGAAPVIARLAREKGILTVGVVTKPFHFEGSHRMKMAEAGIAELQKYVDTLIVIPNQNLFRIANEKTTFADAFKMADHVLHDGVRGVTDLMIMPGLINLDFADVRTVMSEMGKAMMGTGEAEGEGRAITAAENAISNPLLDHCSMKGAKGVLINITGGPDMTLFEVDEAANRIREEVDPDANIIFGSTFNPNASGIIRVSVVATGIDASLVVQNQYNTTAPQKNEEEASIEPEIETQLNEITAENNSIKQEIEEDLSQIYNKVNAEEEETEGNVEGNSGNTDEGAPVSAQADIHETLAAISAARPSFITPKPAEPRSAPQYPTGGQVFMDQKNAANLARQEQAAQPQPKPTMGIFGRMASSVGFRSASQEKSEVTTIAEDAGEESMLDIPAFLRRRKD